jgi:type II secretory pathway pseudopilin PulG
VLGACAPAPRAVRIVAVEVLIIILIVAVIAGGLYLSWYLKKKRREELAATARQLGLQFSSDDTVGCLGFPFGLLTKGGGRGTENVMWGTWHDIPMTEFDYWYYEESTDSNGRTSKNYSRFSCAVTEIEASCSPLTIDRENLLTRLADHMGMHDIEFELEAFNKAFNVKSQNRKFANDMLDPRMMQWLIGVDGTLQFELSAKWLMVYTRKRRPSELLPLLGTAQQFREHVPHVVYDLYPIAGSG